MRIGILTAASLAVCAAVCSGCGTPPEVDVARAHIYTVRMNLENLKGTHDAYFVIQPRGIPEVRISPTVARAVDRQTILWVFLLPDDWAGRECVISLWSDNSNSDAFWKAVLEHSTVRVEERNWWTARLGIEGHAAVRVVQAGAVKAGPEAGVSAQAGAEKGAETKSTCTIALAEGSLDNIQLAANDRIGQVHCVLPRAGNASQFPIVYSYISTLKAPWWSRISGFEDVDLVRRDTIGIFAIYNDGACDGTQMRMTLSRDHCPTVVRVLPGGEGARVGLQEDDVLISYNHVTLEDEADGRDVLIGAEEDAVRANAKTVELRYWRKGKCHTVEVKPGLLGVEHRASPLNGVAQ